MFLTPTLVRALPDVLPECGPVGAPSIVVMGVSGCGKSTVASALAAALFVPFIEGDLLHPPHNVALMAAGTPLSDIDRAGWLNTISQRLTLASFSGAVVACSALKRSYRDVLRTGNPRLFFVHLHGSPAVLQERMATRQGHYMPASLLQSQLDTLELPGDDENSLTFDFTQPVADIVSAVVQTLKAHA